MGSLIEELKRQEEAARAEADRLRARIEELAGDLARAEEQASRLVIAREEVTRVLEQPAVAELPAGSAGEPRTALPIGAVAVPPWQEGADAPVLPRAYQDLLEAAADAGRPLRAREFAAATGLPTEKAKVEGLRSKLRLLAGGAGWPRPLAACTRWRITRGKHRNPDGNGFFFLRFEGAIQSGPQGRRTLHGSVLRSSPC